MADLVATKGGVSEKALSSNLVKQSDESVDVDDGAFGSADKGEDQMDSEGA